MTRIGRASGTRSNSALTAKGITHIVQVDLAGADDVAKSDGSSQPSTHHVASETTSARTRAAIRRRMARHYHNQHFRGGVSPPSSSVRHDRENSSSPDHVVGIFIAEMVQHHLLLAGHADEIQRSKKRQCRRSHNEVVQHQHLP